MSGVRQKIEDLSRWAADPEKMARFEQVALFSQRTSFVKAILCLSDRDDLILYQIQTVCKKHEVPCKIPRGAGFDKNVGKTLGPDERYAVTVLMGGLMQCRDSGLTSVFASNEVSNGNLVDRLIFAYKRYLRIFKIPAFEAPVSFELFYHLYRAYEEGDIDAVSCPNCDAFYLNLKISQSIRCPLCQSHGHALVSKLPKQYSDDSAQVRPMRRVAAA